MLAEMHSAFAQRRRFYSGSATKIPANSASLQRRWCSTAACQSSKLRVAVQIRYDAPISKLRGYKPPGSRQARRRVKRGNPKAALSCGKGRICFPLDPESQDGDNPIPRLLSDRRFFRVATYCLTAGKDRHFLFHGVCIAMGHVSGRH